jgi:hypothetical protein
MNFMPQNITKVQKSAVFSAVEYYCSDCDYFTRHKSHYKKHIKTIKHIKKTSPIAPIAPFLEKSAEKREEQEPPYWCEYCNKGYKYKRGLFRHKKTCKFILNEKKAEEFDKMMKDNKINLMEVKLDHKDEIIDIYEKGTLGNNNTINSNNTNNISINLFLDEHCNDAKTLQDFISQLSFKLEDVLTSNNFIKKDGITNVVIKNLNDLPKTERPIHCTDESRTKFMVKDKDEGWIKDTGDKSGKIYSEVEKLRMNAYVELNDEIDQKFPDPKSDDIYMMKSTVTESIISVNDNELDKRNTAIIKEIAKVSNIKDAIGELNN